MDSQEAVVRFCFEIVGGFLQAVNAATGEVVAMAKAEDLVREKIERATKAINEQRQAAAATTTASGSGTRASFGSGPNHPGSPVPLPFQMPRPQLAPRNTITDHLKNQASEREARHIENELPRLIRELTSLITEIRHLRGSLGGIGGGAGGARIGTSNTGAGAGTELSLRERAMQQIQAGLEQRALAKEVRGLEMTGHAGMMPMARGFLGAAGVGVGMAMAPVHLIGDHSAKMNEIARNAWLTPGERRIQQAEAIPLLGWAIRQGRELANYRSGRSERLAEVEKLDFRADIASQAYRANTIFQTEIGFPLSELQGNLERSRESQRAGPQFLPPADLRSLTGERQRMEDLRLLPLREQESASLSEAAGVQREIGELDKKVRDLVKVITEKEEEAKRNVRVYNQEQAKGLQDNPAMMKAGKEALRLRDEITILMELVQKTRERSLPLQIREKEIGLRRQYFQEGGSEHLRMQLGLLQGREQISVGQVTQLGMMGPEARMAGKFALLQLQQLGSLEHAPQELIQMASAYAPETVRKMAERTGEGLVGEAKQYAPEEYRDTPSDIRKQVDEVRQQLQQKAITDASEMAEAMKIVMKDYSEMMIGRIDGKWVVCNSGEAHFPTGGPHV